MPGSSLILVVDDSPTQLRQMQLVLEKDGFTVVTAVDGRDAMRVIAAEPPMLVVTDLQMPEMNGLELVGTLKGTNPSLPVILTTSEGSEEIAAEALRVGASSYLPKRDIMSTLTQVVRQVLSVNEASRSVQEVAKFAIETSLKLRMDNDESLVPNVITRLEMSMVELDLFDEGERMQIAMALDESLVNAIVHGNLEVSSEHRQTDEGRPYVELIETRKQTSPYKERRVHVELHATLEMVTFLIRDEGPGFDLSELRDPTDHDNLEKAGGRGLLLIHAFMDEVRHNEAGNEIVMVKRKTSVEDA